MAFMTKKLKAVLYGILPFIMIILCASMITYIFAATKFELLISGQIGYEVQKGTGTEEDPFLIYSVGPNDGTAKIGTFNFYAGNNAEATTISALYRIVKADISKASIKVNKQYYTGKEICPGKDDIVIMLKNNVLKAQDYEIISYTNNINKGKAKVTVRGVGDYGGIKTASFTISNKSMYYMISFNGNGATSGSMKDLQIKYGNSYKLTKNKSGI